ncbi:MAG: transcriptional repressor [Alphaproteobacteria bacterium]|nr:MAG: transcriptional repressor [Alphaproteobacteria bacterium]
MDLGNPLAGVAASGASAFAPHDHERCVRLGMARAEAICAARGLRFTPLRRAALAILLEAHKPMGAYPLLDILAERGFGRRPPVAYRALEFLLGAGLVHRVHSLNAFLACTHGLDGFEAEAARLAADGGAEAEALAPHRDGAAPMLMICTGCRRVAEIEAPGLIAEFRRLGASHGFTPRPEACGLTGTCPECAAAERG